MPAPKGHKRYGGRTKGTPNKSTVFSVKLRLAELGVDLIHEIVSEINQIDKPFLRAKCWLQLLEYCDSKHKTVDMVVAVDEERQKLNAMSDQEITDMVIKNLPEGVVI